MEDMYSKLAMKQAEYIDELIQTKFRILGKEINSGLNSKLHGAFLHRLNMLNSGDFNAGNLEKFIHDIGELGYSISQDYLPGYHTTKYEDGKFTSYIDPTKIKLTVTYKVISI